MTRLSQSLIWTLLSGVVFGAGVVAASPALLIIALLAVLYSFMLWSRP